jgi:hypothetical protein
VKPKRKKNTRANSLLEIGGVWCSKLIIVIK